MRRLILSLAFAVLLITITQSVFAQMDYGQQTGEQNRSMHQNISEKQNVSYGNMGDHEKASRMMEDGKSMRMGHDMEGMGFLRSEGNVFGQYVTFTIDMKNNSILNYAINGTPLFNIICDFSFSSNESDGSVTRVEGANGTAVLQIHDNPSAIINMRTTEKASAIHVTFALASGVTATTQSNLVKIVSGDVVGYIGGSNTTSVSISGNNVVVGLPADSNAFFRASPVNVHVSEDVEKRISQEIEDDNVSAEVTFGRNRTVNEVNYTENTSVSIGEMQSDRISMTINGNETSGHFIDMNIDNSSLVIGAGETLGINYDGSPLVCTDNPDTVFNGGDSPVCWISPIQGNSARVIIYVPHYSQHTIDIVVQPSATATETTQAVTGTQTATITATQKAPAFEAIYLIGALLALLLLVRRRR